MLMHENSPVAVVNSQQSHNTVISINLFKAQGFLGAKPLGGYIAHDTNHHLKYS